MIKRSSKFIAMFFMSFSLSNRFLLAMHLSLTLVCIFLCDIELTFSISSRLRSTGDDDGQNGEEHDLLCGALIGGFDVIRRIATIDIESKRRATVAAGA